MRAERSPYYDLTRNLCVRRTVRTETRTQTTFDEEGRPVTRTITERIVTDPDGSETRTIVETED